MYQKTVVCGKTDSTMNRREVIVSFSTAGLFGLAGCIDRFGSTDEEDGFVRPDGDSEAVPSSFQCHDNDFERHWVETEEENLAWGDTDSFSLRIDDLSFEYGNTAELTLENTTSTMIRTGNKNKYNLEILTESGWTEVRGWRDGMVRPYPDDAVGHEPREGFEWSIELTEDGIPAATIHEEELEVCPSLESGRYRFTYWGLSGDQGVAVAFDLIR